VGGDAEGSGKRSLKKNPKAIFGGFGCGGFFVVVVVVFGRDAKKSHDRGGKGEESQVGKKGG